MAPKIVMRCPGCDAKITAPGELYGQRRHCPGCGTPFVVRHTPFAARARTPEDSDPLLVSTDAPPARRGA